MPTCSHCGHTVSDTAVFCEQCGSSLKSDQPSELAERVRELLGSDRKIAAIRILREATGVGLAEAMRLVEALETSSTAAIPFQPDGSSNPIFEDELLEILRTKGKIAAIKRHREQTGTGLKDSKDFVEHLAAQYGVTPERTGCISVLLVGASMLAGATFMMACVH